MSYKSRLIAVFVIVVTAAQVSCFVCFFDFVTQQSVIKQSSSSIIKQGLKHSIEVVQWNLNFSNLGDSDALRMTIRLYLINLSIILIGST